MALTYGVDFRCRCAGSTYSAFMTRRPKPETLLLVLGVPVAVLAGLLWTWRDYADHGVWTGYGLRVGLFGLTAVLLYYGVVRLARGFASIT